MFAALIALSTVALGSPLSDSLGALQFLHEGTTFSDDAFNFNPIPVQYLEKENISSAVSGWGGGGGFPYLYLTNASSPAYNCSALGPILQNTDMPGGDLDTLVLPAGQGAVQCQAACCATSGCLGFTFSPSAPAVFGNCAVGSLCCYLKGSSVPTQSSAGLTSGTVTPGPAAQAATPPHGMRSAVPLGGLAAGNMELRADGTFHEVTIQNAHPAAAAKQGVLADALLGLRVDSATGSPVARALRTHAPPYTGPAASVAQLAYSGAYPVARLSPSDPALTPLLSAVSLYAYAPFTPGSEATMAHPAVAFTLTATSAAPAPINLTLYLAVPWGAINDCDRTGDGKSTLSAAPQPSAGACLAACSALPACAAWTYVVASQQCSLTSSPELSRFRSGYYCGVGGGWVASTPSTPGAGGARVSFLGDAAGNAPTSPAIGDVTLMTPSAQAQPPYASSSPGDLWAAFAAPASPLPPSVTTPAAAATTDVGFASLTATVTLQPGQSGDVSIVWAWHFPHKDWFHAEVGNYYTNLWADSAAVAAELCAGGRLESVVGDIAAHHNVLLGPSPAQASPAAPPNPLPDWLKDVLMNQFSHFRHLHWTVDGRLREYEAPDCPDVDSVHNDYQRHLPYFWAAPAYEYSRFREYAAAPAKDGHIQEYLGSFGLSPLDQVGGRTMADTTTLWITQLYEFYAHTGNASFVAEMWPVAQRAIAWQVGASAQIGLPWHLVCTYDILVLEAYNTTTYNSFLHLLSMRAAVELAAVVGDAATGATAAAAFARGQGALDALLWNSTYSYYRAYTGGDAVMTDALYGQEIALHHGLGWLVGDLDKLRTHLAAELQYNAAEPYGLVTITGRHKPPPRVESENVSPRRAAAIAAGLAIGADTEDAVIWTQSGPTWSAMQLRLMKASGPAFTPLSQADIDSALLPSQWQLDNVRSRLHDLWNFAGINTGGTADWGPEGACGMPFCTSHYVRL